MKKEISYRTYEALVDAVRLDLRGLDQEGFISPEDLLKVAMTISYELGIKVSPNREKVVRMESGSAELPPDIDVLNFALFCDAPYQVRGHQEFEKCRNDESVYKLAALLGAKPYIETRPLDAGTNTFRHELSSNDAVVYVVSVAPDGTETDVPFVHRFPTKDTVEIDVTAPVAEAKIRVVAAQGQVACGFSLPACPTKQCPNPCDTGVVSQWGGLGCTQWNSLQRTSIVPATYRSPNLKGCDSFGHPHVWIKNKRIHCDARTSGTLYLNYASVMEDDAGDLVVIDNPFCNEYYEYALKERIFENMYLNGEDTERKWMQMAGKKEAERRRANGYVNTAGFKEMQRLKEINRKAMTLKYYAPFL